MGFEKSRFVDQSIAEELVCGICRNIFETPVFSECVHTYCLQCIRQSIRSKVKWCPLCRKRFSSKRPRNDDNWINVSNYSFRHNRVVSNIISKSKIKCVVLKRMDANKR